MSNIYNYDETKGDRNAKILKTYIDQPIAKAEVADLATPAVEESKELTKGGKKAFIGEKREFAGRMYIKTMTGWKFFGKGTGAKATEHHATSKDTRPFTTTDVSIADDPDVSQELKDDFAGKKKDGERHSIDPNYVEEQEATSIEEKSTDQVVQLVEGADKKKLQKQMSQLHTIEDLSKLIGDNQTLLIGSPLSSWDIETRKFRDAARGHKEVMGLRKVDGKLTFFEMGTNHNPESFIEPNFLPITNSSYERGYHIARVINALHYNGRKDSKISIQAVGKRDLFNEKVTKSIQLKFQEVDAEYSNVHSILRASDVTREYKDKEYKKQLSSNSLVLHNQGGGNDIFKFKIGADLYTVGGTHESRYAPSRMSSNTQTYAAPFSWSFLKMSNYSPSNGYNTDYNVYKVGAKDKINLFDSFKNIDTHNAQLKSMKNQLLNQLF